MKEEKIAFKENLYLEAKKYGFELNDDKLEKLQIYKNMLIEWNEKINLTSITNEYQIIVKHFIDSLECTKYIKEYENIIDVGTGAGFPGVVIGIFFDGKVNITLLDSLNKRLLFLKEVIKELNLKNITIVHGRAEDKANDIIYREKYDIVVARAVASLSVLCECTSPYVTIKGKCLYMKGDNIQQEISLSRTAFNKLNIKILNKYEYDLEVNEKDNVEIFKRCILEVQKVDRTPKIYPRSYDKIKKLPL
ncbi:MAG: 16S rRNA (guanine(527)-N(7))-methyltransferase RsmG [Clostridia bacterium]|nr:16S rRNA (guanine(527)-N(7))-methyltransferase RsmG [Clostridia bacterium]MDD4386327.1 16S rRNA (guanine(527)-N(7))-methyltransferase RsmG [Clostridia bacterium]